MPGWALSVAYWLHMAATVIWIGGLFFQAAILAPSLDRSLSPDAIANLLSQLRRRFTPLAWLSLAVLIATGLTQMSGNPNYEGFIQIHNRWSAAILAKHLVIGLMVLAAGYQTWVLGPRMERAAWQRAQAAEPSQVDARSYRRLTAVNLALALIVLALTAVARTA
ncbi:MAG: DUF4149 domain-containing protein [Anaerolineales bacterium]